MDSLENKEAKAILSDYCGEESVNRKIEQLNKRLAKIEDRWVSFVPNAIASKWDSSSLMNRCIIQRLCTQIADLESVVNDYKDSYQSGDSSET